MLIRQQRVDNLHLFQQVIHQIETQMQQNPNVTESHFDKSISMKRMRSTQDLSVGKGNSMFVKQSLFQKLPALLKQ